MPENCKLLEVYANHTQQLREIDLMHYQEIRASDKRFEDERDKRYAEGNELRAMALKIKETADANALELASEAQIYKEERNDATREQNLKQAGIYATRDDLSEVVARFDKTIKPILDYVAKQSGTVVGSQLTMGKILAVIAAMGTIVGILVVLGNAFVN